jgi:hypothetical protein
MAEWRVEPAVGVELRTAEPERLDEVLADQRSIALVGDLLQDPTQDDGICHRRRMPNVFTAVLSSFGWNLSSSRFSVFIQPL